MLNFLPDTCDLHPLDNAHAERTTIKALRQNIEVPYIIMWNSTINYQITTLSAGARYILSPSLILNALKNDSMLRSEPFTRHLPSE